MKLWCSQHRTTHHVPQGDAERIIYALSYALADEMGSPTGVHEGEDCYTLVPCPLDALAWSWDGEMYVEAVESDVECRRRQPFTVPAQETT